MPLYGGYVLLLLFSQQPGISQFADRGEFALYSASSPSYLMYTVSKESGMNLLRGIRGALTGERPWRSLTTTFPSHRLIISLALSLTVISTLLFAGVTMAHIPGSGLRLDVVLLQRVSIAIFAFSVLLSFGVTAIGNYWDPRVDVSAAFQGPLDTLGSEFDGIVEGGSLMADNRISVRCIEISQPIGDFYVGGIAFRDLLRISYADLRRLTDRDVEEYLGIQRDLSKKRVEELHRYVNTVDATFPTGIILAVKSEDVEYNRDQMIMDIKDDDEVAKIIDGQLRIAGLEGFRGDLFDLNVTIFVDMDIEDQAMVFATINLAQTKVNKSLVYDLYEYTKKRSPQKTSHNIAKLINSREDSPFTRRIKILGRATKPNQPLTQAAFVESLIRLISGDDRLAMLDRDLIKRGKVPARADREAIRKVVFRNMFIGNQDAEIARVIWNYFALIKNRWTTAWEAMDQKGNMLPKTNGFKAFMRFLPKAYRALGGPPSIPSEGDFRRIIDRIDLEGADFNTDNYPPGSAGESRLARDLVSSSQLSDMG